MKKFECESGRSMVEMLGVLAIIGVHGYKQAMIKVKANEIANHVSIFYTQAMAANGGDCTTTVKDKPKSEDVGLKKPSGMLNGLDVQLTACPGTDDKAAGQVTVFYGSLEDECNAAKASFGNSLIEITCADETTTPTQPAT